MLIVSFTTAAHSVTSQKETDMTFSKDEFEERAAIQEFDGGMSRFKAETAAAKAQGTSRWEAVKILCDNQKGEALNEISKRVVKQASNKRKALAQQAGSMPVSGMQPYTTKEN